MTREAFLQHPGDAGNPTRWMQQSPVALGIIGASRKGYFPVLLPGWGKAWVRDEKASKLAAPVTTGDTLNSPSELVIYDGCVTPALLAFIQLIGRTVKRIIIYEFSRESAPAVDFCHQILIACPQLEELEVDNIQFFDLEFVLNAFNANQCPALKKLTFFSIELFNEHEINAMLRALADPEHAMARQLELFHLYANWAPRLTETTPELAFELLEQNTRLLSFTLDAPGNPHLVAYEPTFNELHNRELTHSIPMPLPRRSVLGFLSVVTGRHATRKRTALRHLDSVLVKHILGYASDLRIRSVVVRFA